MMIKQKMQKGFTLIELLMVVAIIAILSTIILINLDSGRERAEVNRYVSYATQMYRLVAESVAAGQFDSNKLSDAESTISNNYEYCLGDVGYNCGGDKNIPASNDTVYKSLTYLTEMPETNKDNAYSPYAKTQGVYMIYKPDGENVIRIVMPVGTNDSDFVSKLCTKMNWSKSEGANDCYKDVKLHSRL